VNSCQRPAQGRGGAPNSSILAEASAILRLWAGRVVEADTGSLIPDDAAASRIAARAGRDTHSRRWYDCGRTQRAHASVRGTQQRNAHDLASATATSVSRMSRLIDELRTRASVVKRRIKSDGRGNLACLAGQEFARLKSADPDHLASHVPHRPMPTGALLECSKRSPSGGGGREAAVDIDARSNGDEALRA
jgi:hypothetical protein